MNYEHTDENERGVLGSIFVLPSVLDTLSSISGNQFQDPTLGRLFDLLKNLHDQGKPLEFLVVKAEILKSKIEFDSVQLGTLLKEVPTAIHAKYYAQKVTESHRRRRVVAIGEKMINDAADPSVGLELILGAATNSLDTIEAAEVSYSIPIDEAAEVFHERMFNRDGSNDEGQPLATGFHEVDDMVGGMMPGEMIVVAARPGCGKTAFALQIAEHVSKRGKHSMFASLEMSDSELVQRFVSSYSGVGSIELRSGKLNESDEKAVRDSLIKIAGLDMSFFIPPRATLRQIRAAARLQKSRAGLSLLIIDYLGLVRPDGRSNGRYEDMTMISNEAKSMARELKVPVIVIAQLNREAEGQTPKPSHLRDSGAIEQDADSVIFLEPKDWRPRMRTEFNVIIAKNRHGATFQVEMKFEGARTRFMPKNYNNEFES